MVAVDVLLRDTLPLREGRVVSDLERDFDLESERLPERLSGKCNTPQGTTSHVLIVSTENTYNLKRVCHGSAAIAGI